MRTSKLPTGIGNPLKTPATPSVRSLRGNQMAIRYNRDIVDNKEAAQIHLMMDESVPESLKTLMKKVGELQYSNKFDHLLPSNVQKFYGHAVQKSISVPKNAQKNPVYAIEAVREKSLCLDCAATRNIRLTPSLEKLIEKVSAFVSSVGRNLQLNLAGRQMWVSQGVNEVYKMKAPSSSSVALACRPPGRSPNVENWTASKPQLLDNVRALRSGIRQFSTTTLQFQKKTDGKDCKRKGGALPCLKPSGLSAETKKSDNKICEKFCMPCCAPARDPPDCVVAQKKRECKKFKPPRPAYSECKKDPMKMIKPCECLIGKLPPCNAEDKKGAGKDC